MEEINSKMYLKDKLLLLISVILNLKMNQLV